MGSSRFIKTPKLAIVLQVTETTTPETDGRAWEVHDVERNRGFRLALDARSLRLGGSAGRTLTDPEIDRAIGLAIEEALVTPPEKLSGPLYDAPISDEHVRQALALKP